MGITINGADVFAAVDDGDDIVTRSPHLDSLLDAIYSLDSKEDIEALADAVRERRAELRERAIRLMKRSLHAGATVRFVASIRPRYLAGLTATVVEVNRTRAVVQVPVGDPMYGRYGQHTGKVNVQLSSIEPDEG